jgi:hypothetical protein
MGTNYYWEQPACDACGRAPERIHIGKSSSGWCFALHVTDQIRSYGEWVRVFDTPGRIVDEYGDVIPTSTMLDIISERRGHGGPPPTEAWLANNYAVPGPRGLVRHQLGPYCLGHGEGTWDLVPGEFS